MFRKIGGIVHDHRLAVVVIWGLLSLLSAFLALRIQGVLSDPAFVAEQAESTVGERLLTEKMQAPVSHVLVVAEDKSQGLTHDETMLQSIAGELKKIPHVTSVALSGQNGQLGYLTVGLDVNQDQAVKLLPKFHAVVDRKSTGDVQVRVGGSAAFVEAEDQASVRDLTHVEMFALPVTLLVLLAAFGTLTAASLPVLTGICSAMVSLAMLDLLGQVMQLSVFVVNIPTTVGIAVGIDYSLLLVNRFREELKKQPDTRAALLRTCETSGRAIFFSAGLVMLGTGSLLFFDSVVLRSVMVGGVLVILMTLLCSLTLIPAVLAMLGERVNRGAVLPQSLREGGETWRWFAHFVMRHPWAAILTTLAVLGVLISPLREARFAQPGLESLPKSYEVRQTMETLYERFGKAAFFPMTLLVEKTSSQAGTLDAYMKWLRAQKEVGQLVPVRKGDDTQITMLLRNDPESEKTKAFLSLLRHHLVSGYQVFVTGAAAADVDFDQEVAQKLPRAILYVLVVTFVVLLFVFRSVVLPLKALLMNALSLTASFGVLVWIFVGGHGASLFHVEGAAAIDTFVPLFVFAFVFGTSMDYEVFMLSRIQEEYEQGASNEEATAKGLAVTSRLITAAALVLMLHTGAFAYTDVLPVKEIGLGLALAILIDASLIRMLLVPSLMKVLGDWNWKWPFAVRKKAL